MCVVCVCVSIVFRSRCYDLGYAYRIPLAARRLNVSLIRIKFAKWLDSYGNKINNINNNNDNDNNNFLSLSLSPRGFQFT